MLAKRSQRQHVIGGQQTESQQGEEEQRVERALEASKIVRRTYSVLSVHRGLIEMT